VFFEVYGRGNVFQIIKNENVFFQNLEGVHVPPSPKNASDMKGDQVDYRFLTCGDYLELIKDNVMQHKFAKFV